MALWIGPDHFLCSMAKHLLQLHARSIIEPGNLDLSFPDAWKDPHGQ